MALQLDEAEVRVLGALMEKEVTTPEYYPLSLNALVNACNQKSNREPVVNYENRDVAEALESLRQKGLARTVMGGDTVQALNDVARASAQAKREAGDLTDRINALAAPAPVK